MSAGERTAKRIVEDYAPGARLPIASDLALAYECSDATVRRAIRFLVQTGFAESRNVVQYTESRHNSPVLVAPGAKYYMKERT